MLTDLHASLNTDFADPEVIGNYVEAAFWIVVGIILAVACRNAARPLNRVAYIAAALMVIFGASDVVEAQTGAWWRPPWLLVWKALCLMGLVLCYGKYRKVMKSRRNLATMEKQEQTGPTHAETEAK